MTFCTSCGAANTGGGFCSSCGARLSAPEPPMAPVYPPYQPAPPPQEPDRTWIPVVAIVLALVLASAGGVILWNHLSDSGDQTSSLANSKPDKPPKPSASPGSDATASAVPSPTGPPQRGTLCPDGSEVPSATPCRVDTAGAARAAFGLAASECVRTTLGADHTGPVNLLCRGGLIHLGIYTNAQKRLTRLQAYGFGSGGCQARPGAVVLCGPTKNGRWIRSYDTASGLLIFASVEDGGYSVLSSLNQLTANALRRGSPTG